MFYEISTYITNNLLYLLGDYQRTDYDFTNKIYYYCIRLDSNLIDKST